MLNLTELKNQIKYFECLDVAVKSYKMMLDGEAVSFNDGVKKQKRIPLINNIQESDVLLANHVLKTALSRLGFMMTIREEDNVIKFDSIQEEDIYLSIRDKILEFDNCLTQADCSRILTQISNAIAHGDILTSFDFELFNETITKIYDKYRSLNLKHQTAQFMYADGLTKCAELKFNYETFFELDSDGNRRKLSHPIKKQFKINHDDLSKLIYLISDNKTTKSGAYVLDENGNIHLLIKNSEKIETFFLDDIQKEAIKDLEKFYMNQLQDTTPELAYQLASMMAISKVLMVRKKLNYFKIREIVDVGITIAKGLKETKRTKQEIQQDMFDMFINKIDESDYYTIDNNNLTSQKIITSSKFNIYTRTILNAEINNVYKNFLAVQTASLLQIVEQNQLKRKIGDSEIIQEIAADFYEKEEFTDKEILKVIDNIRDAFTHGTYINNTEDKFDIYDQISRSDKTLEYKFTLYSEDLEKINDACLESIKELMIDMQRSLQTSPVNSIDNERTI